MASNSPEHMEQTKPTTRAEEIAGDGPYTYRESILVPGMCQIADAKGNCVGVLRKPHDAHTICAELNRARSLAQPPSSEVIIAGNAMRNALQQIREGAFLSVTQMREIADAALAHPKDPAPTVERDRIKDVAREWILAHDGPESEDDAEHILEDLVERLKTLFP